MSRLAFEQLVERESADLLRYLLRRVEIREDAADLLADTLLIAWRRFGSVPADPHEARLWLFGVARRVLAGHHRSARRRTALADRLRDHLAGTAPVGVRTDDDTGDLRAALQTLPRHDLDLIGLVHWEGFALAEAAGILGIRPGAARMRYARIRDRLRRELSPLSDRAAGAATPRP